MGDSLKVNWEEYADKIRVSSKLKNMIKEKLIALKFRK